VYTAVLCHCIQSPDYFYRLGAESDFLYVTCFAASFELVVGFWLCAVYQVFEVPCYHCMLSDMTFCLGNCNVEF